AASKPKPAGIVVPADDRYTADQPQIHFLSGCDGEKSDCDISQPGAGRETFQPIEHQHEDARRLAEKAEDVRRPNIPAADRANVNPFGLGHKITCRNGTEQISPDN